MGKTSPTDPLSRRERQIMDAVFALTEASVADIRNAISDPPSENAVRTLVQILEEKGHLKRRKLGRHFVFSPKQSRKRAGFRALEHVLETFFEGSIESAVAAHLLGKKTDLDEETLQRLRDLVDEAEVPGSARKPAKKSGRKQS